MHYIFRSRMFVDLEINGIERLCYKSRVHAGLHDSQLAKHQGILRLSHCQSVDRLIFRMGRKRRTTSWWNPSLVEDTCKAKEDNSVRIRQDDPRD